MHFDVGMTYALQPAGIAITAALFGGDFRAPAAVQSWRRSSLLSPSSCSGAATRARRSRKTRWLLAVIGVLALGVGYYIALTTTQLVNGGGPVFRRGCSGHYRHLLPVSGREHRRAEAAEKAQKLLLQGQPLHQRVRYALPHEAETPWALPTSACCPRWCWSWVSTTVSLYIGMEDAVRRMYPRDIVTEEHLMIDPDGGADESQNIPVLQGACSANADSDPKTS